MIHLSWSNVLLITHILGLMFWMGGLFVYLFIVWPAVFAYQAGRFPRDLLGSIAIRTAPWIYFAMMIVLATAIIIAALSAISVPVGWVVMYFLALFLLIGNNVFGTLRSWPTMLFASDSEAKKTWNRFFVRMASSFVIGMTMVSNMLLFLLS